jgi:hypothetical protein
MKFGTHIRIRITRDLNDRLEQLISKAGSKSDYIRTAIKNKIKQDEMIKIGITGHPDFPLDDWTKQTLTLGELFEMPHDLTPKEIEFAHRIMDTFNIESDDDEGLIELITKPSDFMSFLVHIKRILDQYHKQSSDK